MKKFIHTGMVSAKLDISCDLLHEFILNSAKHDTLSTVEMGA
ncbi:MAG: hypothetical protein ACEY3J_00945 [Arsenophonus sp.]